MPHSVYIKHSSVLNKVPATLEYGELAINYNSEQPMLCIKTVGVPVMAFRKF